MVVKPVVAKPVSAPWAVPEESPKDRPFTLERIPGGVVEHRMWREARAGIMTELNEGKRILVLLGDPGAGKTLLLREIAREIAGQSDIRLVDDADLRPPMMLIPAGRRSADVWLLAGQRGFETRAKLWGDSAGIVWLRPMPPDEVGRFVAARLHNAGRERDLFDAEAVQELARRSDGLPRRVLILAGDALREAEAGGEARVMRAHVRAAADKRILRHLPCSPPRAAEPVVLPTPLAESSLRVRRARRPPSLRQAAGYGLAFTAGGAAIVAMMLS